MIGLQQILKNKGGGVIICQRQLQLMPEVQR